MMTDKRSRKMISAMQVSLDGFIEDAEGKSDFVESWADGLQLIDDIDTFLLGGHMYPGYGEYWGSIYANPGTSAPNPEVPSQESRLPSDREIAYAKVASKTPHIVLSTTLTSVAWPKSVRIVRELADLRTLKNALENDIYVVGGAGLVTSLMNADLIDELRLIVHPVILGSGKPLFDKARKHLLDLKEVSAGANGKVIMTYRVLQGNLT